MVVSDLERILNYLVRTKLWSRQNALSKFKHLILDVDSIVDYIYQKCIANHILRQRGLLSSNQRVDLYTATIVNYKEFNHYVQQLFDFLDENHITPILVYEGKLMEAPLFGMVAAQFSTNVSKVSSIINSLIKYDNGASNILQNFSTPNLAHNIFKSIVNAKRTRTNRMESHQAFYCSFSLMAKLARDYNCPVLTNRAQFIVMDVRAGFVLVDEFWFNHIELHELTKLSRSKSISNGKPRSRIKSSSLRSKSDTCPDLSGAKSSFHQNIQFIHQHPGLSEGAALVLFPMTTPEFMVKYGKSLKKMKVYSDEYSLTKDFRSHQKAANRMEMILYYLSGKSIRLVENFIKSESIKTKSSLKEDFRELFNYHAVAYDFKTRLRFILKYLQNSGDFNYIESCLTRGENTADFLLDLLACSIGHLASVNYNRFMQFEDLKTKHSTHSLLADIKCMLMSLFSSNKLHKSERSTSKSKQDNSTRYSQANLTVIDRNQGKLIEHVLDTTSALLNDQIRSNLAFSKIAHRIISKQDSIQFINSAFKTKDLLISPRKLDHLNINSTIKCELSVVLSLTRYATCHPVVEGDKYFTDNYTKLIELFELAIINQYIYHSPEATAQNKTLVDYIRKNDLEKAVNINQRIATPTSPGKTTSTESIRSTRDNQVRKRIRHLIEMLNATLEAYHELNSFFEHPLPRLQLHLHLNHILLYNLTVISYLKPANKFLSFKA